MSLFMNTPEGPASSLRPSPPPERRPPRSANFTRKDHLAFCSLQSSVSHFPSTGPRADQPAPLLKSPGRCSPGVLRVCKMGPPLPQQGCSRTNQGMPAGLSFPWDEKHSVRSRRPTHPYTFSCSPGWFIKTELGSLKPAFSPGSQH